MAGMQLCASVKVQTMLTVTHRSTPTREACILKHCGCAVLSTGKSFAFDLLFTWVKAEQSRVFFVGLVVIKMVLVLQRNILWVRFLTQMFSIVK